MGEGLIYWNYLTIKGNYCVELHYDIFGDYLTVLLDQINEYFLSQNMNNTKIWSTESDLSLLHLIAKVNEEERNLNLNQTYLSLENS